MNRATPWTAAGALTLAALVLSPVVAPAIAAPSETGGEAFIFDVTLAAVCLAGTFPIAIATDSGPVSGTVTLTPEASGVIRGTLDIGEDSYAIKGAVRFAPSGNTLKLTAKQGKKARLVLDGRLVLGEYSGTAKNKGSLLPGATGFVLDASQAGPLVAQLSALVRSGKKGKLTGSATVDVCGAPLKLKVSGKERSSFSLRLKGKGFRFAGSGTHVPGDAVLNWSAKGFGARVDDGLISVDTTLPPRSFTYSDPTAVFETEESAIPNEPRVQGDTPDGFEITPAVPSGLTFDTTTGVISGTPTTERPTTRHTVTATNVAGTATTTLDVTVRRNRIYSLAPQTTLGDADLRHFLTRTQWGVELDTFDDVSTRGLPAHVDDMLDLQVGTAWELSAQAAELRDNNDPQGLVPGTTDVTRWWQAIMMDTETPFQEVLAFFWADLFAVGNQDIGRGDYMVDYVNLYRRDGAGNLRDLLVAMSRHPAILRYLNGDQNRRQAPNENFAREFWELFTLGVDNGYTQADIVEASGAFTGWRERSTVVADYPAVGRSVTTWHMEFDPSRHDTESKTFLGVTVPGQDIGDDFESVVDITLAERDPENYISRKLLEQFVMEEPPEELVTSLGALLRNGDWELAPALRTLFLSEAFFSRRARGAFVKSPVEFGLGFVRTTGLRIRTQDLDSMLSNLGMRPTQPPVVDGWPSGATWLSAQSMVDRTNLTLTVVNDVSRQESAGIDVRDLVPPLATTNATEIVDALAARLQITLTDAEKLVLRDYVLTIRENDGDVVASALTEANLGERIRGLLYVLSQHPTYHVR